MVIYFIAYHTECRETFLLIPCRRRVDWHYCSKYIKASTGRLVLHGNLSWEKISHATICLRGLQMLFLLTVIVILVNELPRKMIRYQVIIFTQGIKQVKASFPRRSACCCWAAENFPCGFDLHYNYLDSGHTRPPVLKKKVLVYFTFFGSSYEFYKNCSKYLETPSTCVSMH